METGKKIYVDSNVFIAAFNPQEDVHEQSLELFSSIQKRKYHPCTASLTIDEIVHQMKRISDRNTAMEVGKELTRSAWLDIVEVDRTIMETALEIMAHSRLDTRDALHAACAIHNKTRYFVTFDKDLQDVQGLKVKTPKELHAL